MSHGTVANRDNLEAIEAAHNNGAKPRNAVDPSWRNFFEGFRAWIEPVDTA